MARPRTLTDEAILTVAREAFLTEGALASTTDMAKRLGVTQPAIFKRFGSKRALMRAALAIPSPPVFEQIEAGPTGAPLHEQLLEIAVALDTYLAEVVTAMSILRAAGCAPRDPKDEGPWWPVRLHEGMVAWFGAAGEVEDAPTLAMLFVGGVSQIRFMWSVAGYEPHDEHEESLARLVRRVCPSVRR